jgi:4'-phosphopantetheinyl transferase
MNVYWAEQTAADLPATDDWLSSDETIRMNGLRIPKRCADWRMGRWTAKHAVAAYFHLDFEPSTLAMIAIRAETSGAPAAFLHQNRAAVSISISHRGGTAACAVAAAGTRLGCDLELIEPRSDAFVEDYFTAAEREMIARPAPFTRDPILALLWSAKESALKLLHSGLRLDTRSVSVEFAQGDGFSPASNQLSDSGEGPEADQSWHRLRVRFQDRQVFHGWWQRSGQLIRTFVAAPETDAPLPIAIATLDFQFRREMSPRVTLR